MMLCESIFEIELVIKSHLQCHDQHHVRLPGAYGKLLPSQQLLDLQNS